MGNWLKALKYDPVGILLSTEDRALSQLTRKYLLEEKISIEELWQLPEPKKLLKKQTVDGFWNYSNAPKNNADYDQYQTFLNTAELVEKYAFNKNHESIRKVYDYFLSFQTEEGDIRGIYGNQYSPNYTAAIVEILIKAGYDNDFRISKSLDWLYKSRQSDGGWALAFRTRGYDLNTIFTGKSVISLDKTKPSSVMITGVCLRAFSISPEYKNDPVIKKAAELLVEGLFLKDAYPDRSSADFWYRFGFPFIYTDLLSALDSLSLLKTPTSSEKIAQALQWFIDNQKEDGSWELKITRGRNKNLTKLWLSLAIAKVFKRFYN